MIRRSPFSVSHAPNIVVTVICAAVLLIRLNLKDDHISHPLDPVRLFICGAPSSNLIRPAVYFILMNPTGAFDSS
jgi:hypothetical protein